MHNVYHAHSSIQVYRKHSNRVPLPSRRRHPPAWGVHGVACTGGGACICAYPHILCICEYLHILWWQRQWPAAKATTAQDYHGTGDHSTKAARATTGENGAHTRGQAVQAFSVSHPSDTSVSTSLVSRLSAACKTGLSAHAPGLRENLRFLRETGV